MNAEQSSAVRRSKVEAMGVFLYRLGTASSGANPNEEHIVFTNTKSPKRIGLIGKVGGRGPFIALEHLEDGMLTGSDF
jgi:hypothetical protein